MNKESPLMKMQYRSIYKVPKGKLLKIRLKYDEKSNLIDEINITGDFFAYPEESIESMENKLKDTLLEKEILLKKIGSIVREENIQFIGVDVESLTKGILMCKK